MDNAGLFNGLFRGGLFQNQMVFFNTTGLGYLSFLIFTVITTSIYHDDYALFYETMNVKEDTGFNCKRRLILYCFFFNVLNEHHIHLFILKIHCYASSE